MTKSSMIVTAILLCACVPASAQQPAVQKFLQEGKLADGAAAMQKKLEASADDAEAGFSLGVIQFFQAVEGLGQDQYRYGLLGGRRRQLPMMRLPVPENDSPEQISYAKARRIIENFLERLTKAEATLAKVKPSGVKLPLKVGQVRLDLNGDGVGTDEESLLEVMNAIMSGGGTTVDESVNQLVIAFDDGDVLWLRGYCHVMSALCEVVLAYDWKDQFERTAHLFYPNVETPYQYLVDEGIGPLGGFNTQNILDVIAMIHTVNYECTEPKRMQSALTHLETVVKLSRESWKLINAETDNDQEWLPNPKQTAAFSPNMRVTPEMQAQWFVFLDEADAILQGKKLLPFWRGIEGGFAPFQNSFPTNPKIGINLRKVFTNPQRLDLVLWIQGTGLHPFLETGSKTDPQTWDRIFNGFRGQFFLFMTWFN